MNADPNAFTIVIMTFVIWTYFYWIVPGVKTMFEIVRSIRIYRRARRVFAI